MNKIYRLVWNKSLNLWTVVSENARGTTKKRNVNTNISIKTKINSSAVTDQQAQLKPTLIALALSSVFFSTGALAGVNTGGGDSSNGSSMAISPTIAQCGTGGVASITNGNTGDGGNSVALGCGNKISGTDSTWQQFVVNRRGGGNAAYGAQVPIGDKNGVFTGSTAVGRQNNILGQGGATVVGTANVSQSSSQFHNVLMGQGNSTVGTGGYNTLMGIGNQIVDDAAAKTDGTGVGTNSIAIGVANRVTGQTSIAFGRQSYADADYSIAQGNVATVQRGATGGIALGFSATVSGKHGVAIGSASGIRNYDPATSANAAEDSVAVGTRTNASTLESVAIGAGSEVTGTDIGMQQRLADRRSNVVGATNVYPDGKDNVLSRGTAVGQNNKISNRGAGTAIGSNNSITAASDPALAGYNVVIGQGNLASQAYNTGIGIGNDVSKGISSTAIGVNNIASGNTGIAMGRGTQALADFAIAQGNTATVAAGATGGIALGNSANTTGIRGIAIGSSTGGAQNDTATAPNAIGMDSIALGTGAKGISNNDIAIGRNAATAAGSGGDNIAMGNSVTTGATGKNVAIGSDGTTANSRTGDGGAVSIGRGQRATGDGAVAIGDPNVVNGDGAVATGRNNTAAGDTAGTTAANGAVAVGNANQAIGQGSVALGNTSVAAAAGAIALGDNASAQAVRGIALGSGATAANASDVALGSGSVTDAANPTANGTVGGVTYNYAGTSPSSVVSVGSAGNERQVTNVAAGRVSETSTDAINGSQLYSTQQALGNLAESTANHLGGGSVVNPDGTVSAPSYSVNGNNVSNVGDAITELDKGWNLQSNGANAGAIKAGDTVDIGTVANEENLTVTKNGKTIQYGLNRNLKVDSVTAGDTVINNNGMTISNGPSITKSGINAAGSPITNVGAGVNGTDAVNKDQLDNAAAAAKTEVTEGKNITVTKTTGTDGQDIYNVATKDSVDFNNVTVGGVDGVRIDGTTGKISGVADGTIAAGSTEAINGSQLAGTAKSVSDALGGGSVVNPDGTVSAPSYSVNGNNVSNVGDAITELDKGWNLQSNGANAGAIKAGDTVDIGTVANEENLTVTKNGKTIQYGLNRNLKVDSVTAGDTVINDNGVTISNGPSMTKSGINAAGNSITNVAAGVNNTDAVNKGQLDNAAAAAKTEVTEGKNITVTKTTGTDGQDIYNVATANDVAFDSVKVGDINLDGTTGKISGVAAGDVTATSTEAINGSQLAGTAKSVSDALGGGSVVNPDGTVSAPSYSVNGNNVSNVGDAITELDKGWNLQSNGANAGAIKAGNTVDIGTVANEENLTVTKNGKTIQYGLNRNLKVDSVTAGDTVINDNGVTIRNGPSITKSGINAAGNPITNVGAGVNNTDAVNKGQLDNAAAAAKTEVTEGKNITVTKTTGTDGQDIYNVATKDSVDFNNVTVGGVDGVRIDGATGKISGVAAGDVTATSTEAINGSQLAGTAKSVSDALGGGSVVNPDGTVSAPSYSVNGNNVSNVGDAITELDKGWNLQSNGANAGAIKAGDTVDIGTVANEENLTVTKNGKTIQYGLNRNLKVDSVTAGDTVINDNGVTISNGPSITKSGINAAGNPITNVGPGVNNTDAVNKGQLDNAAAAAKTEVTEGKNITVTKTTGTDGQDIYNVATKDSVDFNNVTVGGVDGVRIDGATGKISGVAAGDVTATSTEAINGSQLAGTAKSVSDALGGGSVVNPDGTVSAPSYSVNGNNVSNVGDAITELDKGWNLQSNGANAGAIKAGDTVDIGTVANEENLTVTKNGKTIQYGLNRNLKVDSVTAGDTVINDNGVTISNGPSMTKSGINAAGNSITNVAAGVNNTDAVNKGQLDNAAAAAKTEVTEGKNITVTKTTGTDGQDIYNVATKDSVDFNNVTVGGVDGVRIDGTTGKISGVAAGDVTATSTEAINGSQLAGTAKSVSDALGGGSVVNPDGTVSAPSYSVNGNNLSNVGDAITELDKGWNLQSNGANAGAIKAGDTVDIGTVANEENLTVTKNGKTIQYGLNRNLKVDSVTAGDTVINDNGVTISNGPSMTKSGINAAGNPITNVGAGVNGTDAVNKGQLDNAAAAAKTEVTEGKNITVTKTTGTDGQDIYNVATKDSVDFNNVTVGGVDGVRIDGTTGKISGVADGTIAAGSTEAINGGQLHGVADSVRSSIGGETVLNPDGTVTTSNVGNTGQNNIHDAIDSVRKNAVTAKTTVTEGDNMVVTKSTNPDGSSNYEVATAKDVKFDSVTATDADGNESILTAKGVSLKDQAGNTTVLGQDGLGFVDSTGNPIGPRITAGGINAGNTVIGGVAAGRVASDSQDAINGSQLKGVSESVSNAIGGNTTVNPDGTINTSNIGGTGKDNINDAIGAVGKAAQAAKTTVSKAEGDENITINRSTNADGSTDYKVGLAKDINVDSVTAGGTKVDGDGLHITGGPSVTKAGINAGDNKVTGVADGTVAAGSQDAINGGQLHGVADSVKNVVGGNATVNPDGSITTSNVGGTGQNNINDAINSVRGAAAAAKSTVSNKDGNISVTPTTKADGSKDYEVGLAKDIKVDSVTAANQVNVGGSEGTTIAADGVRIAEGPSMTKAGIDAGRRKVTGVSEGTIAPDSKDAINGSQLHQSYENVGKALGGGAGYDPVSGWTPPNYEVAGGKHDNVGDALNALNNADQALGDRITNLGDQMQQAFYDTNQRIDDVKKHANAGVAAAMALETAPYISGKYTYAVGAAYHGGENAVGVTLRKTADNGRWSLTTGVAAASQGDPSFRIGLSGVFD
ncbi:ESPR-type extended signal peptide-containing protein [Acinetobacter colistiniresistens]|uniref:ESPR-type extended signal peptide-containing protein n=1 Tax=Acinetobacter colistiniresistens TaxID=280145 RepID=UPI00211CCA67|nr:ESPR-type extended signal peptide-containing protein [Acinetobacter colistiniresistens]UUM27684.1 ESPR-type extended signal peptide-containing protein [Acinetobacter colistiniresistens]